MTRALEVKCKCSSQRFAFTYKFLSHLDPSCVGLVKDLPIGHGIANFEPVFKQKTSRSIS